MKRTATPRKTIVVPSGYLLEMSSEEFDRVQFIVWRAQTYDGRVFTPLEREEAKILWKGLMGEADLPLPVKPKD